MRPFLRSFLIVVSALLCSAAPALAERKLAFVAGINAYPNLAPEAQLERAVKDAETVADTLQGLGFTVVRLTTDVNQANFLRQFANFVEQLEPGDTVLVYFSGHGISLDKSNFLIPADIPKLQAGDERLLGARAIAETDLIEDIGRRGVKITIMVIDACRNNPFPREGRKGLGLGKGFARLDSPNGVMSIYAAGAGQEALDHLAANDTDANSVFTRIFVKYLKTKGLNLSELGDSVRDDVDALTNHAQVPGVYNQIVGQRSIYLAGLPTGSPSTGADKADAVTPPPPKEDPEIAYNKAVLDNTKEAFEKLLRDYPDHPKKDVVLALYQMRTEEGVWKSIEQATDSAAKLVQIEMLLKVFPKGIYAERAAFLKAVLIQQQEKTDAPPPPPPDTSQQDFDAAQAQNTSDGWNNFLSSHRSGTLAELARFKLREIATRVAPKVETADAVRSLGAVDPSSYYYVEGLDPKSKTYWLALRNAPSFQAPWSSTHIPEGALLTVLDQVGEWYHVRLSSNETGWASKRFIHCCRKSGDVAGVQRESGEASFHYVAGIDPASRYPWLALRSAPDPNAGWSDTHLEEGTLLTVLEQQSGYSRVRLQSGETGWASSRFIACCRKVN